MSHFRTYQDLKWSGATEGPGSGTCDQLRCLVSGSVMVIGLDASLIEARVRNPWSSLRSQVWALKGSEMIRSFCETLFLNSSGSEMIRCFFWDSFLELVALCEVVFWTQSGPTNSWKSLSEPLWLNLCWVLAHGLKFYQGPNNNINRLLSFKENFLLFAIDKVKSLLFCRP